MWLLKTKVQNKWSAWFFQAFIATLPFKTALFVYATDWGRGFNNPYLSFSFSLPEFFLLLSGICFFFENKENRFRKGGVFLLPVSLLLGASSLSLVFSSHSDSLLKLLLCMSLFETLLIYLLLVNKVTKVNQCFKTLTYTMSIQALLGILQTLLGHSIGLSILGEPQLSAETANIARLSIGGWEWIRAYGTFSHPNILGGFLAVSLLGTVLYPPESKKTMRIHLGLQSMGLLMSFSRSALLGLIVGVLLVSFSSIRELKTKKSRWLTTLLALAIVLEVFLVFASRPFPLSEDPALQSRWTGYEMGLELLYKHPLGVGYGLETAYLDEVSDTSLKPWEYQPSHNIFLLTGAETGYLGLLALLFLIGMIVFKLKRHNKILGRKHENTKRNMFFGIGTVIIMIGLFDHYWMSLEEGRFLAIIVIASISRFLSDPLPIFPIKKVKDFLKNHVVLPKKQMH